MNQRNYWYYWSLGLNITWRAHFYCTSGMSFYVLVVSAVARSEWYNGKAAKSAGSTKRKSAKEVLWYFKQNIILFLEKDDSSVHPKVLLQWLHCWEWCLPFEASPKMKNHRILDRKLKPTWPMNLSCSVNPSKGKIPGRVEVLRLLIRKIFYFSS